MPKVLVNYVRYMGLFNTRLGGILKFSILVMLGILVFEGISRYALGNPTIWSLEMGSFVLGALFLLGGGYVLLREEHIRMDIFYTRWSPRTRAIVDIVTFPLMAIYLFTVIEGGISRAAFALRVGEITNSFWGPPTPPIMIIVIVGTGLLLLQGIAVLIKDVSTIRGKPLP